MPRGPSVAPTEVGRPPAEFEQAYLCWSPLGPPTELHHAFALGHLRRPDPIERHLCLGIGIGALLVLPRYRAHLATPGPWIAAAAALLFFSPHLAWQLANGWPAFEFAGNSGNLRRQRRGHQNV